MAAVAGPPAGSLDPVTAVSDEDDPLVAVQPASHPPWRQAWQRLRNARLPRHLRTFGWRLLHAALQMRRRHCTFPQRRRHGDYGGGL